MTQWWMTVGISASLVVASASGDAPDEGAAETVSRPAYSPLRFTEDWSTLKGRDTSATGDWFDRLKYVPLSEDGAIWASFGGQARLRIESWDDFAFGAPADDNDTFALWRLLLHGDVHFGENVRLFVEGKSALSTDRDLPGGRRTLDVDAAELQQAFVDVRIPIGDAASLTLRPGRQSFLFGKQRLVSPLPWANTQRHWDGVSAILDAGGWRVHGFWSQFAPVQKYDFNDPDAQTEFWGVYATTKFGDGPGLDLYALALDRDDPITVNGTTGPEERYTLGARLFGPLGDAGLDYDVEGAYQFGEVGAGDVTAYMFGGEVGWKLKDVWSSPRLSLGVDYGSGDDEAGGDVETFNQLFPLGHAYLGYMDFVGRQNVIDLNLGVKFSPTDRMTVAIAGHAFWRASDADALYNAGGGVVRPGGVGLSEEIGQEVDVTLSYRFSSHLTGLLGYSRFFAGDFIDESGAGRDMDFAYLQLQFTF